MSVVDVAMVGRLGADALAATGMGSMMLWGPKSGHRNTDRGSNCYRKEAWAGLT